MVLCFTSPQLQASIREITNTLTAEKGLTFKPEKGRLYLNLTEEQFHNLSMKQKIQLKISIYGVFTQSSDNLSYLQMRLNSFNVDSQDHADHDTHDNVEV